MLSVRMQVSIPIIQKPCLLLSCFTSRCGLRTGWPSGGDSRDFPPTAVQCTTNKLDLNDPIGPGSTRYGPILALQVMADLYLDQSGLNWTQMTRLARLAQFQPDLIGPIMAQQVMADLYLD